MGLWCRVNGTISVDVERMYKRFNLNKYNYHHYQQIKAIVEKWVNDSFKEAMVVGLGLDSFCSVTFDENVNEYYNRFEYDDLIDPFDDDKRHQVQKYTSLTFHLNCVDRNSTIECGTNFVNSVFEKLKTNSAFISCNSKVIVSADYNSEIQLFTFDAAEYKVKMIDIDK